MPLQWSSDIRLLRRVHLTCCEGRNILAVERPTPGSGGVKMFIIYQTTLLSGCEPWSDLFGVNKDGDECPIDSGEKPYR